MCIRDSHHGDRGGQCRRSIIRGGVRDRVYAPIGGIAHSGDELEMKVGGVHRTGVRLGDGPVQRRIYGICLLYTSDAADERSSVDLGGRRIIKKKKTNKYQWYHVADAYNTYILNTCTTYEHPHHIPINGAIHRQKNEANKAV